MKLKELWRLSPQASTFIVYRDDGIHETRREEYHGDKTNGERTVERITPTSYPMMKHVLEVELK